MRISKSLLTVLFLSVYTFSAQAEDEAVVSYKENTALTLYANPTVFCDTTSYYRIPAITMMNDGTLLGFSDVRIGGTGDIGGGEPISILVKRSTDNGKTWSEQSVAVAGDSLATGFDFAHGDAAVVTDSETGKMILLCASGKTGYSAGGCSLGCYYSTDGITWTGGEITDTIKAAFTSAGLTVTRQFFTSGRMIQSKKVKVGSSYRIYSALCTGNGSIVVYSDDFGGTWAVLGGKVACSGGDETVLEELPNGDLLLSARLSSTGRRFNVFNYSDLALGEGTWNTATTRTFTAATNCNAEMLLLPTQKSNFYVLLHSVSLSGRTKVTVYYKVINTEKDEYNTPDFYKTGWKVLNQMSETTSCYSTMVLDKDGNVAYLFEENSNGGYDIQYRNFTVGVEIIDAIKEVTVNDNTSDACYNLAGQSINPDTKGIIIMNGKRVIRH